MTPEQTTYLTEALGTTPTTFQNNLFLRLSEYLNRQPTVTECRNMSTDSNLVAWVLANQ